MTKSKPFYRFTLTVDSDKDVVSVTSAVITKYSVEGCYGKKVIRYRDERTHALRDIKGFDVLFGNVMYSYDSSLQKAVGIMKDRTEAEIREATRRLNEKSALYDGLCRLSFQAAAEDRRRQ
jgi:hypothetical protein